MALNIKALKGIQDDLNSRTSGDNLFVYNKDIGEETPVRILPPIPRMEGVYFLEVVHYWINNKKYISPKTFGEDCPIEAVVDKVKDNGDPDLMQLYQSKKFSKRMEFWLPILLLEVEFDNDDSPKKIKVADGRPKVYSTGTMMIKQINRIITNRMYQNGTEDGVLDRVKGHNLMLGRHGEGLDTEYTAAPWPQPTEMDAKYYEKIPDVIELCKKQLKSDAYLKGVVNNYFYGEEFPEDESRGKSEPEAVEEKPQKKTSGSSEAGSRSGKAESSESEQPKSESKKATSADAGERNVMDDLGSLRDA